MAADIVDVVGRREKMGELQLRLGKWDQARDTYLTLLTVNPENYTSHRGLQGAVMRSAEWITLGGCDLPVHKQQ